MWAEPSSFANYLKNRLSTFQFSSDQKKIDFGKSNQTNSATHMANITDITDIDTIEDGYERDLLDKIENHLRDRLNSVTNSYKLYFSGEYGSQQTIFETMSNHLELGVLSKDRTTALVLLRFVRMIIEENPELFLEDLDDLTEEVPIELIVERLATGEENYLNEFELNEALTLTLYNTNGEEVIDRIIETVDIWTLSRTMNAIKEWF